MQQIAKYGLKETTELQRVDMPMGAEMLSVQALPGGIILFVLEDPANPLQSRRVQLLPPGKVAPFCLKGLTYFGAVVCRTVYPVWHMFVDANWEDYREPF